jgi:hypothetical protein
VGKNENKWVETSVILSGSSFVLSGVAKKKAGGGGKEKGIKDSIGSTRHSEPWSVGDCMNLLRLELLIDCP